ncbi:uncharacterized protein LOC115736726 [Rhodamnia argentea]|uniref:Uncharacterized protein LOC115736726 n=1 Tax=Rhodamnia argentea TaxID=178133 RepID=A0A8B8NQH9_9MYRT|nr:uncharacterized protein LOC115736726 [Rhodamnia argentea]
MKKEHSCRIGYIVHEADRESSGVRSPKGKFVKNGRRQLLFKTEANRISTCNGFNLLGFRGIDELGKSPNTIALIVANNASDSTSRVSRKKGSINIYFQSTYWGRCPPKRCCADDAPRTGTLPLEYEAVTGLPELPQSLSHHWRGRALMMEVSFPALNIARISAQGFSVGIGKESIVGQVKYCACIN